MKGVQIPGSFSITDELNVSKAGLENGEAQSGHWALTLF